MNAAFWILIGIGVILLWAMLIALFRPVGKLIGALFRHIEFIINGNDPDNNIENIPTVKEINKVEAQYCEQKCKNKVRKTKGYSQQIKVRKPGNNAE